MAVVSVTILFILYKNPILVAHKYLSSWCKYIYTSALKPSGFSRINTLTAKGFSNMEQTYKEIKQYTPQQEQDMLWSMFDDLWPEHEVEVERTLASELADVERKAITLKSDVKTVGKYEASVKLHKTIVETIEFEVVEG